MKSAEKVLPIAAVSRHVGAHATTVGRWIVEEMEGWYRRRLAARALARHLGRAAR